MGLVVITEPSVEPVSLIEAKAHLRVDSSDEDTLISALITTARQMVEQITDRALITQTLELIIESDDLDDDDLELPRAPLQSVTSIKYTSPTDGSTELTWSSAQYHIETSSIPGEVEPNFGYIWPVTYPGGIYRVRYVAGYGASGSNVPGPLKSAILLIVGHLYENREAVTVGAVGRELPLGIDYLLAPYRVFTL